MAVYVYRCGCGNSEDAEFPIGTAQRMKRCPECGGTMRQVLGVGIHIAAAATPNRKHAARTIQVDATEKRWGHDMAAYKRMVNRGLEPEGFDGCARLENEIGDQNDIEYGPLIDEFGKERIVAGLEEAAVLQAEVS